MAPASVEAATGSRHGNDSHWRNFADSIRRRLHLDDQVSEVPEVPLRAISDSALTPPARREVPQLRAPGIPGN